MKPLKHVVQVEVHAPMEPPEPEVSIKLQVQGEALDQIKHHHTPMIYFKKTQGHLNHNSYQ